MQGRTLLFGVGATKAGTSWLHRYLSDHPQCDLPNIKELHYFDRIGPAHLPKELERLATLRGTLIADSLTAEPQKAARLQARADEVGDWIEIMQGGTVQSDAYLAYLNRKAGPDVRLVGDITPAYGLLDESVLRQMVNIAPNTRFILLLRDPLDRLWSNLRMMAGWRLKEGQEIGEKANFLFNRMLNGKETPVIERSDYIGMVSRLQAVVPAERLYIDFYETLFTQAAVDRISAFLGLEPRDGPFERRIHASPAARLNTARVKEAGPLLLPHYDFVQGLKGDLPARWRENRAVLC